MPPQVSIHTIGASLEKKDGAQLYCEEGQELWRSNKFSQSHLQWRQEFGFYYHFGFYYPPATQQLEMSHSVCKVCKTKVRYFGNTTNARAHTARHLPELEGMTAEQQPPPAASQRKLHQFVDKLPANSERAKKINKSISCFMSKDLRPYSVVEYAGFRFVIKTIEPKYIILSHQLSNSSLIGRRSAMSPEKFDIFNLFASLQTLYLRCHRRRITCHRAIYIDFQCRVAAQFTSITFSLNAPLQWSIHPSIFVRLSGARSRG